MEWKELTREQKIAALECIISMCKRKCEDVRTPPHTTNHEQVARDEGFRGALAWVEHECVEEINWLNGFYHEPKEPVHG